MKRLEIKPYTFYIECFMDLNHKPPVPVWFNTYVEIKTVYRHKKLWRNFLLINHVEEYYKSVIESSIPFVASFLRVHIVIFTHLVLE